MAKELIERNSMVESKLDRLVEMVNQRALNVIYYHCGYSFKIIFGSLLFAALGATSLTSTAGNVILIIGDGMDDHQITIARNYLVGSRGKLTLDQQPLRSYSASITLFGFPSINLAG
jgi:alkaline phosphatase